MRISTERALAPEDGTENRIRINRKNENEQKNRKQKKKNEKKRHETQAMNKYIVINRYIQIAHRHTHNTPFSNVFNPFHTFSFTHELKFLTFCSPYICTYTRYQMFYVYLLSKSVEWSECRIKCLNFCFPFLCWPRHKKKEKTPTCHYKLGTKYMKQRMRIAFANGIEKFFSFIFFSSAAELFFSIFQVKNEKNHTIQSVEMVCYLERK